MIMKICTIYDGKADAFMTPMFFQSTGQAVRSLADAVNDGKSDFAKHPEDYTLFCLGDFDQRNAALVLETAPVCIGQAIHLIDRGNDEAAGPRDTE